MEKDNEVKGTGNSLDFGARIYDSRIGRWLSLDRYLNVYPGYTPYGFALNSPIQAYDGDGNLVVFVHGFIKDDGITNRRSSKNGEQIYFRDDYNNPESDNYWTCMDDKFMEAINDFNSVYFNGESGCRSQAINRMKEASWRQGF